MNIRELLSSGSKQLDGYSDTPRLDCTILLSYATGLDRAKLLASYPDEVLQEQQILFNSYLKSRIEGHPVAYILGEKEFYGHNFHIENGVLTPRPDTEILIETALNIINEHNLSLVLDMCTGTGCIGITLQKEIENINVTATDISPIAKRVFEINNEKLVDNKVKFITSDLFQNLEGFNFDIIVTNPPYLTKKETMDRVQEGWQEPTLALDGGLDGLDLINTIINESPKNLNRPGWLIIEASPEQMTSMKNSMELNKYTKIEIYKDLAGFDRIIVGKYE